MTQRIDFAVAAGIGQDRIVVDPGIGFGKTVEHNLQILAGLRRLADLGPPLLLGTSRKSFIGKVLGVEEPKERLTGTIATNTLGLMSGARILRVHDVKQARQTIDLFQAITRL